MLVYTSILCQVSSVMIVTISDSSRSIEGNECDWEAVDSFCLTFRPTGLATDHRARNFTVIARAADIRIVDRGQDWQTKTGRSLVRGKRQMKQWTLTQGDPAILLWLGEALKWVKVPWFRILTAEDRGGTALSCGIEDAVTWIEFVPKKISRVVMPFAAKIMAYEM